MKIAEKLDGDDGLSRGAEPDPIDGNVRDRLSETFDTGPSPNTEWWEKPYNGGGPAKVEGFPRALYPPDAKEHGRSEDGPDVIAYKRTVSRLGRWPWQPFDDAYYDDFAHGKKGGNVGDSGVAGVQRQQKISPAYGWIGEPTFNALRYALVPEADGFSHGGEQAMDATARNLIDQAYQRFHAPPASAAEVAAAIADYCERTIRATVGWHYRQARAMQSLGDNPDSGGYSDCSEHATCTYFHAKKVTGVAVPDPNHSGYNGYGYTGTLVSNPWVGSPYKVGDLAIYGGSTGTTEHVCTCYEPGGSSDSEWCSHGSEAAPYAVELHYRGDLLCVVRPGLLP